MTDLPTTTGEITAEWMTDALRGSNTIGPDVTVVAVDADPANAGVGFMGEVATVGVTYDGGEGPSSVVAKFPTGSPDIRTMMFGTKIYEREHRFYHDLAPLTPMRTPEIYHVTCEPSDTDPMAERFLLLMEDLGGLTIGDQLVGVTPNQAEAALTALAQHHARFWGGVDLGQDYIPIINGPLNQAGQGIYQASYPGFLDVFGETLRPEMLNVSEGYAAANPKLLDALAAMPHTLVHFDFRADNLFFDDDGVVCIDWQAISQGGGAADVGYFLGQNLEVEDRRTHEADLLRAYHGALTASGVSGYDFDTFFQDYRLGLVYGWIIPVMAIGSLDVSSERAMALWTAVIERAQSAVLDHDAGSFVL